MEKNKSNYINSVNLMENTDFPYLVLDVVNQKSFPQNPGFQVMHWHEDFQFIYVIDGKIKFLTLNKRIEVSASQGIFINKNILHQVKEFTSCHYKSFVFPDYFLKFYFGSPAGVFVDSISENEDLEFYHFTGQNEWENTVLNLLQKLTEMEEKKTEFYPYEILLILSSLWLTFRKNILLPPQQHENIVSIRMQKFLNYIANHYAEDISLESLVKSGNVGKSECLRCFKASLQTTPYKYLMEYRLSKAADLLKTTDLPIGVISENVGFHQVSHFGKCFKEKTGYSPKDYRKNTF
ncbi:MAG: helix-turn-helix domain-containing protein [Lachnospiraceae bacterium]